MKMLDENITLDIEKINGYLEAVGLMNHDDYVASDYFFVKLPDGKTLIDSVNTSILNDCDKFPIEYWHVTLEQISEEDLQAGIEKWFFRTDVAEKWKQSVPNLVPGLLDLLQSYVTTASIYKLNMTPPMWHAIRWDEFVLDSKHGRFLLGFNFSD
ncbi:hypothetical protein ABLB69_05400 [Xenorhabdus khoisanae]|uniref:hypothetical protein n=1 Tax=Xenorhabdus khoisanae TaxID=880157 RepID=UPI0032B7A5F0